jgi:hypothetical protein
VADIEGVRREGVGLFQLLECGLCLGDGPGDFAELSQGLGGIPSQKCVNPGKSNDPRAGTGGDPVGARRPGRTNGTSRVLSG